jgi:uncharacterized protein (TIGR04255 family)
MIFSKRLMSGSFMAQGASPLPEFANPPVSEVALSVEFTAIDEWRPAHAGLYWARIKSEYPVTEAQPPLASQIERFGERLPQVPAVVFDMADPNAIRSWFLSDDRTKLIQVQRDRFVVNWRKMTGAEVYPRYEREMRPRFEREWRRFEKFLQEESLGSLRARQCEITYVNDIPRGEGWNTPAESLSLFSPWWGDVSVGFLKTPELVNVAGSFRMPGETGRLHFATQNVVRNRDQLEAVQLRLTARGFPDSQDLDGVLAWMDLGREWIVRGFADITSPSAHALWERKQ